MLSQELYWAIGESEALQKPTLNDYGQIPQTGDKDEKQGQKLSCWSNEWYEAFFQPECWNRQE